MDSSETYEQAALRPVPRPEGVESPIDDPYPPAGFGSGELAFGGSTQFGAPASCDPQIPRAHERRGEGPATKGRPNRGGRVAPRPLRVRSDRYHARGTGADLPRAGEAARDGPGPNGLLTMSIALSAGRFERPAQSGGQRTAASQSASPLSTARNHWLSNRSSHARAVRATCSENPVSRCCTRPSDHSRKT